MTGCWSLASRQTIPTRPRSMPRRRSSPAAPNVPRWSTTSACYRARYAAIPTPRRPRDFRLTRRAGRAAARLMARATHAQARRAELGRCFARLPAPRCRSASCSRSSARCQPVLGRQLQCRTLEPTQLELAADASAHPPTFPTAAACRWPAGRPAAGVARPPRRHFPTIGQPARGRWQVGPDRRTEGARSSADPATEQLSTTHTVAGGEADAGPSAGDGGCDAAIQRVARHAGSTRALLIAASSPSRFLVLIVYARRRYADPYLG